MEPEQQLHEFGLAAIAINGKVVVLDGPPNSPDNIRATMTPKQAQRFAHTFAAAYVQAAGGTHRAASGAIVIGAA